MPDTCVGAWGLDDATKENIAGKVYEEIRQTAQIQDFEIHFHECESLSVAGEPIFHNLVAVILEGPAVARKTLARLQRSINQALGAVLRLEKNIRIAFIFRESEPSFQGA